MKNLVSIITPCFNGEKYISRFIDSILAQSYSDIELILVNDGSTDKTEEIIRSYEYEFEIKGYTLRYLYQENQGQASAINKGLAVCRGEFITWPDSDDLLSCFSIESKVKFLINNQEYGGVRTDISFVNESNLDKVIYKASDVISFRNENIFEDLIFENNVYFCPGGYMITKSALLRAIPKGKIYESKAGQNWQMLLPVFYYYKCGFIDDCLYTYVIRGDSHSHSVAQLDKEIDRCDQHLDIILTVLSSLDVNQNDYKVLLSNKYSKKKFMIACKHNNYSAALEFYKKIEKVNIREFTKLILLKAVSFDSSGRLNLLGCYIKNKFKNGKRS